MSAFQNATDALPPKTTTVQAIAMLYASVLVGLVVAQLFTFDEFQALMAGFLPESGVVAYVVSSIIVVAEVLALPFLLRMRLSLVIRVFSMVAMWLVPVVWLVVSLWPLLTDNTAGNIGFLGTVAVLVPGWWAVFLSGAFLILAAWISWGMWPLGRSLKK